MSEYKEVTITHFINPHLFWYYERNTIEYRKMKMNLEIMEKRISQKGLDGSLYSISKGDMVAVYFFPWKRYVRARIDHVVSEFEYVLWIVDYGFPLQASTIQIYRLKEQFKVPPVHIKIGGIMNIAPKKQMFFFDKLQYGCNIWSNLVCSKVKMTLKKSQSIFFKEYFEAGENHYWGEIHIILSGHDCLISEWLKEVKCAYATSNSFKTSCHKLPSVQIDPWFNNHGIMVIHNNNYGLPKDEFLNLDIFNIKEDCLDNNSINKVNEWFAKNEKYFNILNNRISPQTTNERLQATNYYCNANIMQTIIRLPAPNNFRSDHLNLTPSSTGSYTFEGMNSN